MPVCYIVGAAPKCATLSPREGDLVIAADGGYVTLAGMGILPHLAVGDFDSSQIPSHIPTVRHPVEKDDTDTALALAEGMRRGYTTFALYGCTGGRPDHTFGAVQTALGAAKQGCRVFLVGEDMIGTVLVNESFSFSASGTVSVFSLSEDARGVTLSGLKYSLEDATLTNDFPLGVSNEAQGETVTVSVRDGALYLLWEANALPVRKGDVWSIA